MKLLAITWTRLREHIYIYIYSACHSLRHCACHNTFFCMLLKGISPLWRLCHGPAFDVPCVPQFLPGILRLCARGHAPCGSICGGECPHGASAPWVSWGPAYPSHRWARGGPIIHQDVIWLAQSVTCHVPHSTFSLGHSLGGSVAALVALMLRLDARLEEEQRMSTRAVCFSCVSMVGKKLSKKCRPFVTTVVVGKYGNRWKISTQISSPPLK